MYYPAIGLEVHIELKTKTKLFCSCLNDPQEKTPNLNICPICLGHPGVLPALNNEALKKVIKTGLALNCQINKISRFDRKNYFYPDLPKGYQISQLYFPLCKNGFLEIADKKIRIREIHLEEDTAKLLHPPGKDYSLIDFNRAGVPLMELVTEPDLKSAEEAKAFAEELRLVLLYLDISDTDMEKGQMRIEANVSISQTKEKLGTRVEIKNINSFRAVEKAINYEIERQIKDLEKGKRIFQETVGWDDEEEKTIVQREKEMAFDYRYFPEPDLPVVKFSEEYLKKIKNEIVEIPSLKRKRFQREYFLSEKEIETLVKNKNLGDYFEKVISELPPRLSEKDLKSLIKISANYFLTDLLGFLKEKSLETPSFPPDYFSDLIFKIFKGEISSKIAKTVLERMVFEGKEPQKIISELNLNLITNESLLEEMAEKVIKENPQAVADYKQGKENVLQFLIGKAMALTKGKADPNLIKEILKKKL